MSILFPKFFSSGNLEGGSPGGRMNETNAGWWIRRRASSLKVCKQPWGGDSLAGITCSCGYIPGW